MPKFLRKQKLVKKIFYVLAIIIIPSFVLWGSASVIRDKQSKGYAGKIFGKNISYEEYGSALNAWRNQLKMKFGDKAGKIETIFDANQAVWDRLILRYGIKNMGIKVSNEELTQQIASLPFLQKNGVFDQELYDLFLRYSLNIPARIFEEDTRETLKFQKIFEQLTKDTTVSDEEVKERYKQDNEQIKVKYISALNQDSEKDVNATDEELQKFYDKVKDQLKISIQINLSYIGEDYPQNATNEQKETINNKFKEISAFIKEGNDLTKAKEKFGLQIQETGFTALGDPLLGVDWPPEDLVGLFNLMQNEISDVVKTSRGPYIFQSKEKRLDYLPTLGEVKDKIKDAFVKDKSRELAKSKIDDYYSQITAKKQEDKNLKFTKIIQDLSIPVKETEFFTRYSEVPDVGAFEDFNEAASNLAIDQISNVIELPQGYFIIIEVSQRKPIDETEFEKVKETLKKELLSEKKNKIFEQFFAQLKQKANLKDYVGFQQKKQPAAIK